MLVKRNEVIGSLPLPGQREKESGVKKKMVSEQEVKGMGREVGRADQWYWEKKAELSHSDSIK